MTILSPIWTVETVLSVIALIVLIVVLTHIHTLNHFRENLRSGQIIHFKYGGNVKRKGTIISINYKEKRIMIYDTESLESHFVKFKNIYPFKEKKELTKTNTNKLNCY